jgi:trk system potassium uptake protein TrkA
MKLVVIGCGRVGSAVALDLADEGWDVTVVDEQEEALARLGARWSGGFVVGHGMDADILKRAGVPEADAVVVATRGDNTNLVIGQVVQKRWDVPSVVVRVLSSSACSTPRAPTSTRRAGCGRSARRRPRSRP